MREVGRGQMGHYPTPERVVGLIASWFRAEPGAHALDAGCGTGEALASFASHVGGGLACWGVELDSSRAKEAEARFHELKGACLEAAIEHVAVAHGAGLLWFNPPYDTSRGRGRMESALWTCVRHWCRTGGHCVAILPEHVLQDMAGELEREYETEAVGRFPEPEYDTFQQAIWIGIRRANPRTSHITPDWAWHTLPEFKDHAESTDWPSARPRDELGLPCRMIIPAGPAPQFKRTGVDEALAARVLAQSPLGPESFLRGQGVVPLECPPLPLTTGHVVMAMTAGQTLRIPVDGEQVLVKATVQARRVKDREEEVLDGEGRLTGTRARYRTHYSVQARVVRASGEVETYSSEEPDLTAEKPKSERGAHMALAGGRVPALRDLAGFIGESQLACIKQALKGEEGNWFRAKLVELAATVHSMPKTYEQDGKGDEAIVHLHYFKGSADWWIIEKDKEAEQHQAFGYADLFGDGSCAELGYISLVEILDAGAELDLHWTPKTLREVKAERRHESGPSSGDPL